MKLDAPSVRFETRIRKIQPFIEEYQKSGLEGAKYHRLVKDISKLTDKCKTPLLKSHIEFLANINVNQISVKPLTAQINWKVDVRPKKGESWKKNLSGSNRMLYQQYGN